jgi:hypothetical protein
MIRHLGIIATLALGLIANPLCAANKQDTGTGKPSVMVWTNEDLEKLRALGLISIIGQVDDEESASASLPETLHQEQDPAWYADQAAQLRDELEDRQEQLREYRQALDDTRSLKDTTGGVYFDDGDNCLTPNACIQLLQQYVNEVQANFAELEELARRNGIPPGVLRGQEF